MTARRPVAGDDAGITLIEMLVAMVIMTIVMSMFTGAMLQMFRAANHVDANSQLQSQLHRVFIRLDKEVRYASAVSDPGSQSGADYVEYLLTNSSRATCVELRLVTATQRLERRTWQQGTTTIDAPGWTPLAFNVTAASATDPAFKLLPATGDNLVQRLNVDLRISSGGAEYSTSQRSEYAFSALNSDDTSPDTFCVEGRSLP